MTKSTRPATAALGLCYVCGREIVFGNYAELEGREFDCHVCQRAASSIARINRSTEALRLLRTLLPMLERKGARYGAGVCVHDVLDQEQYKRIYERVCAVLEIAP